MNQDERDRHRRQIEQLLEYPGVGALRAGAITSNLGVPHGALQEILEALVEEGLVVRTGDGRFAVPTSRGRE